jgi:PAS domain S-box-containing protein
LQERKADMSWLARLHRHAIPETVVALTLVLAMGSLLAWALATFHSFRTSAQSSEWVSHTYQVREAINHVLASLVDAEASQRQFVLTGHKEYLDSFSASIAAIETDLDRVAALTRDNAVQEQALLRLRSLTAARLAQMRETLSLYNERGQGAALALIANDRGKATMDKVRAEVAAMLGEEQRLLEARRAAEQASVQQSSRVILLGAIGLLMLITVLAVVLYRGFPAPLAAALGGSGHRSWPGYAMAAAGVVVATWVRWVLGHHLGQELPPYITFYPIIILAALFGGTGAGLVATALCSCSVAYFFLEPRGSLLVDRPVDMAGISIFAAINLIMSVVGGALRRARARSEAEARRAELSERRLRATFDQAAVGIFEVDLDDRITAANRRAGELLRFEPEDLLGKSIHDLTHPEDRTASGQLNRDLHDKRLPRLEYEKRYLRQDGSPLWVHVTVAPVRDSQGHELGAFGTFEDITQRRHAESALRESEERFRLFMDNNPTLAWVKDEAGRYVYVNRAYEQRFGLSLADCRGRTDAELWPPETAAGLRANDQTALAAGRPVEMTEETTHQDGSRTFWFNTKFAFHDSSGQRFLASIGLDITPRKQAEDALARERAFLEAVLQACPAGVIVAEPGGKLIRMNPANERLWGLAPFSGCVEEYRDWKGWWADGSERNGRRLEPEEWAMSRALKGEVCPGDMVEIEPFGSPGTRRIMINSAAPVRGPSGELWGAVIAQIDITERRRAMEQYQRQVRLFEGIASATPDFVYIFDRQGRFVYANRRLLEVWGLKPEDAVGKTCRELGYEQWHHDLHMREIAQVIETKRPIKGEVPFKAPLTGIFGIYDYIFFPVIDPKGEVEFVAGITRDMTERKQAEQALRLSEHRLRVFFDSDMVGTLYWNRAGEIIDANNKFFRLLGYTREDLQSGRLRWSEMTPPEYRALDEHALAELQATGVDTPYEKEFLRKDGTRVPVIIGAAMLDEKRYEGVAFVLDIVERKRAQRDLERRNRHLQLLHQAAAALLQARQPVDVLTTLHQQIARNLGTEVFLLYTAGPQNGRLRLEAFAGITAEEQRQLAAMRYGRAICAQPSEALRPIIATHIQTEQAPNRRFVRKLGFHSYLCYPLLVGDRLQGTLTFASRQRDDYDEADLDFFHTIARTLAEALERHRLESELQGHATDLEQQVQERTARLRETVAELEGFSYSLVHDMRAPLRAMLTYASVLELEAGPRLQPGDAELLRRIKVAAQRMDALIIDSLNYSRILREELPLGPVNLGALLRGMVETYPNLQPPGAEISLEVGDLVVHSNESALTQVFSNLLGNAVKFVAPGVKPRVRVWAEPCTAYPPEMPQPVAPTPQAQGHPGSGSGPGGCGFVTVCIQDNGIGIPQHAQEKIFAMFQRMHRAGEYPGTGIGLALVRKSLERTGGYISLQSEPEAGSRFCVHLALARQPPVAQQPDAGHEQ